MAESARFMQQIRQDGGVKLKKLLFAGLIVTMAAGSTRLGAQSAPNGITSDAAAVAQFEQALAKYVALRESLVAEKLAGPIANSSPGEVSRASDMLAAAIQRARSKARPGDVFVSPVTPVLKRRIIEAIKNENLGPVLANIDDETVGPTPAIHLRFPVASPMATMPPSLLKALPPLPKNLEYRILGQYLVLRDVEAALIIDFIPAVIPR
jgi:hypothetical protein